MKIIKFYRCKVYFYNNYCTFQEKGGLIIENEGNDEYEMIMMVLNAGAEDFNADEDEVFVVTTAPEDFGTVREALEEQGVEFLEAVVKMIPDTYNAINKEDAE
ncbi:hypothetical protein HF850_01750 [Clostridium sp. SM-530-WT-3G]|nr:hypothetical protein [Clostridium sp. SM-530-WT-3G]